MTWMPPPLGACMATVAAAALPGSAQEAAFDRPIVPLLIEGCIDGHGGALRRFPRQRA
jgi:hypothetical protein